MDYEQPLILISGIRVIVGIISDIGETMPNALHGSASAVFAVMCPSVRPSVRHKPLLHRNDWTNRAVLAWRLPSTYPSQYFKEICVSPKMKVLPAGTLSQTQDLEKITPRRCQQNSSSSSTVELIDDTYTTIDESWLFTTSRSTVTL